MRKQDIKPGVVYAYKYRGAHPLDPVVPIVFLSNYRWIGALRQDARGYGDRAFKHAHSVLQKPRAGTVYNDGTIGYPAVIIDDPRPTAEQFATMAVLTLQDFDRAREPVIGDGPCKFILVTSMARVTGEWEG
jgi:hypothetical protein